ncbi:PAS domain-containing sensor histidine kinase [Adhaeribacter soli]|uniref:histidine kinase n=1 Tax=Adhaeribacter soli TaxID=2607655 RepID=A0A5N1J9E2_9BACT|nr:PAS domain-containing sensor histidine kinase [Adhaeribacter soli]KAA9345608.1 PAS domain S-box protein [Adhaeribacter soli]
MNQNYDFLASVCSCANDLICVLNQDGEFLFSGGGVYPLTGFLPEELTGRSIKTLCSASGWETMRQGFDRLTQGLAAPLFETQLQHRTGEWKRIQWSLSPSGEEGALVAIGRELPAKNIVQTGEFRHEALYRILVAHGTDMAALINEKGEYIYIGGSSNALTSLGYRPENLLGRSFLEFTHPEDLAKLQALLAETLAATQPIQIPELRFRDATGNWHWVEVTVINQLYNPKINALIVTSHDITERIQTRQQLQESEQRFKALFENNPSTILLEDRNGMVLDVNPALLHKFGVQKADVVNHSIYSFLPADLVPVCKEMIQRVLAGNKLKFELELPVCGQENRILEVNKIPVKIGSEIAAVYTIAKDITQVTTYYKTVQRQAQKLNTIFESITDAFFTLDRNWHFTSINSEFARVLGVDRNDLIGQKLSVLNLGKAYKKYFKQLKQAAETGESIHFEIFLNHKLIWLEVRVFPSEEGLSVYFTDVTEKVKARQELEKLSLVANKTINGVIFIDAGKIIEWVNEGFTNLTGYTAAEAIGQNAGHLLHGPDTDQAVSARIKNNLQFHKPFREEILNYKKTGEKLWFALDFSPVLNNEGKLSRYIVIQTDITYRKEAEAAQLQLTKDLYRQNRDMQQFTYIVSHNLRGPVANAMGYAQVLTETNPDTPVFREMLANLKTSVFRLDGVLKDLNQILSIRDNKDNIGLEKVDLAANCRKAVASLQESLESCQAEVKLDIKEGTLVHGNKTYLHSVFYNLLSNAIKYRSPERRLQITIATTEQGFKGTTISFSDNGSGFDLQKAGDQVFKLYKRFHHHTEGRGIGLFLVKTHIEAMGGQIEVSSQVDNGTTFLIQLK